MALRSVDYAAYLLSPAWRRRRSRAIRRAGGRCQWVAPGNPGGPACGRWRTTLHVHHLTYARLGREADEDLQVLCARHHAVAELLKAACPNCGRRYTDSTYYAECVWDDACHAYSGTRWAKRLDAAEERLAAEHRCPGVAWC